MAAKKKNTQHKYAIKVSDALKKAGIKEYYRDAFGNPFIKVEDLKRLPKNLYETLEENGHHRICLKLQK